VILTYGEEGLGPMGDGIEKLEVTEVKKREQDGGEKKFRGFRKWGKGGGRTKGLKATS